MTRQRTEDSEKYFRLLYDLSISNLVFSRRAGGVPAAAHMLLVESVLCQCEHMDMYMCVSEMRAQHNAKPTCAHVCTVRTIHSRTGLCIHTFMHIFTVPKS